MNKALGYERHGDRVGHYEGRRALRKIAIIEQIRKLQGGVKGSKRDRDLDAAVANVRYGLQQAR